MATIAVVKMLIKVQKDFKMDKYRRHEKLNKRMPGYEVKMGFGLHVGYSIEGAIGSSFKIDASYLSPHANMANKLEEQTKEHGVPLIIHESIVEKMTPLAKSFTRRIDKIKLGEQEQEFLIYTIDLDLSLLKIEEKPSEEKYMGINPKILKILKRHNRIDNKNDAFKGLYNVFEDFLENDADFKTANSKFTKEFYDEYNLGFDDFINGKWKEAKAHFERSNQILGEIDQPTNSIINFMSEHHFEPGHDWKGYRTGEGH